MLAVAKAEKLRALVEAVTSSASELDDNLATLEDSETKGEDRDQAIEEFQSTVYAIGDDIALLTKAMDQALK